MGDEGRASTEKLDKKLLERGGTLETIVLGGGRRHGRKASEPEDELRTQGEEHSGFTSWTNSGARRSHFWENEPYSPASKEEKTAREKESM